MSCHRGTEQLAGRRDGSLSRVDEGALWNEHEENRMRNFEICRERGAKGKMREQTSIDNDVPRGIMAAEEVAQFLRKSVSWVYKNSGLLGGRKLGGSLFFPTKEDLYEHLFCQGQGMEVRLHARERGTPRHGTKQKPRPRRQKPKERRRYDRSR